MVQPLQDAVQRYAEAHAGPDGFAATPVRGLGLMRADAPTGLTKAMYRPLVCLVLQGCKQLVVGPQSCAFQAGQSALVSADTPVVSRITQASRAAPFLSLAVELDAGLLTDLAGLAGPADAAELAGAPLAPVLIDQTDAAVADAALRLVRLFDQPEAIPVLAPLVLRELHYWLLMGRHGACVRRLGRPGAAAQRIAKAVAVLRAEFCRPLAIERLAAVAGMSGSTFHHHFRAVTSLSPLQFQKQLRLIEARHRMLAEGLSARAAAFAVGYESVPHFTRDYTRMYGLPPGRDRVESRAA